MKSNRKKNQRKPTVNPAQKLAILGARICGALTGATAGMIIAGPQGAVVGAAAGPLVTTTVETAAEIITRNWSKLEGEKLGAGYYSAVEQINLHLSLGGKPRSDGFFQKDANARSPAEEVLEGVLERCKKEHEEKKIQFIGYIFANAAFSTCPPEDIHCLLHVCERLTYRQFCLLTLISGIKNSQKHDTDPKAKAVANATDRLFVSHMSEDIAADENNLLLVDEFEELTLPPFRLIKEYKLTLRGQRCVELLGLHRVPESDLVKLRKTLLSLTSNEIAKGQVEDMRANQMLYKIGASEN